MKALAAFLLATLVITIVLSKVLSHERYSLSGSKEKRAGVDDISSISKSLNEFSFMIGKKVSESHDGNMVYSPYSIFTALVMLLLGAQKKTKNEILSVLKWKDEKLLDEMNELHVRLSNMKTNTTLKIADKLWVAESVTLLSSFKTKLTNTFQVDIGKESFGQNPEDSRNRINEWINKKTRGNIKELFPPNSINSLSVFVLANAIYFKGSWANPFNKQYTEKGEFHVQGGATIKVPFMFQSIVTPHGVDTARNVQLLEIPYDEKLFSMIFAIPRNSDINKIVKEIDGKTLNKWFGILNSEGHSKHREDIEIFIPKFEISQNIDLKKYLKAMGIRDLFTQGAADLSAMTGNELYLSQALHKSFVKVDEEGTIAAGAGGVVGVAISMPEQIRVNKPFLFFIIHKKSNAIMFSGKVMNPIK